MEEFSGGRTLWRPGGQRTQPESKEPGEGCPATQAGVRQESGAGSRPRSLKLGHFDPNGREKRARI